MVQETIVYQTALLQVCFLHNPAHCIGLEVLILTPTPGLDLGGRGGGGSGGSNPSAIWPLLFIMTLSVVLW